MDATERTPEDDGRVAVVTGAAGGVGRALVDLLVDQGYAVVAEDVAPAVERYWSGGSVVPLRVDVTAPGSAEQAVATAEAEFGRLDLLVNNAARFLRKPIADSTDEDLDGVFAVNVGGAFRHARAAVEALARTRGSIVTVTSISGLVGMPNQSVYAMTKGALVQLTRQLAIELAPRGVRVNAVAPGAIDTDFIAEARGADPDPEATAAAVLARHPLGRISTPEDVARAIAFLASPAASGITGTIVSVDGGYVAQ
ncbi:SDR family oxidoreductase [Pseudonocardia xishanensis]|uniref:SDR family oxidoreductase n=1 Tax=Pseudonocardia xishanensis TaxID=630995 RepID=A0ABP8S0X8_9PSEU